MGYLAKGLEYHLPGRGHQTGRRVSRVLERLRVGRDGEEITSCPGALTCKPRAWTEASGSVRSRGLGGRPSGVWPPSAPPSRAALGSGGRHRSPLRLSSTAQLPPARLSDHGQHGAHLHRHQARRRAAWPGGRNHQALRAKGVPPRGHEVPKGL